LTKSNTFPLSIRNTPPVPEHFPFNPKEVTTARKLGPPESPKHDPHVDLLLDSRRINRLGGNVLGAFDRRTLAFPTRVSHRSRRNQSNFRLAFYGHIACRELSIWIVAAASTEWAQRRRIQSQQEGSVGRTKAGIIVKIEHILA